ncbi:MAG: aldehyde dehydrogenase family protein [Paludibacterium sp.]|uniref:aldehyde dehydrogenase family protein n=1 Tax=Paludibacterium sp. TaxID=1917523 RepID=UPI0025DE7B20|nr:aldehyde dehydrogenase family protein [Paludibacterium sp.]MBV8046693.1 aldehyde dehydrogenase family protein [Paludibacterium sp.]MBV8647302.1 aldehyde dehydrogenase family protein [Paludibacterium sp.]
MSLPVYRNYINGRWLHGSTVGLDENPSELDAPVGEYVRGSAADANEAIEAAAAAQPVWADCGVQRRADLLDAVGSELLARKQELGLLLAREEGKTLPEAVGEVARAGQIFKFFAGEALRVPGESLASVRPGIEVEIRREPVGVVGLITPWNFPMAIPAWKIAPALAYGNTVVFKPAELVPGCAWALADILHRAGVPAGVFNMVMGSGRQVGQAIVGHALVDAVSFTGSTAVGRQIRETAGGRGARVQLEMGGKNPLIVLNDADLDVAVNAAVNGAFFSTGQRCTASSRLIVEEGIRDRFVQAVRLRLAALKVGNAVGQGVEMGPVVDERQLQTDLDYIRAGVDEGAELLFGGDLLPLTPRGHYLQPTLFAGAPSMRIAREEIFGPVAVVMPAASFEHALQLANDTEFGLCAGICTQSLKYASQFKRQSAAGMVMVNLPTAGVDYHVPFGGRKASSAGPREQGRYAAEFYTSVKTAYTAA